MKYLLLYLSLTIGVSSPIVAQQRINGKLQTSSGQGLPHANVTVSNQQGLIVGFEASDGLGNFSISLPDSLVIRSCVLEVRHLGYESVRLTSLDTKQHYTISMVEKAIDLSEVEVKSRPRIDRRRDTLAYDVNSFAKNEDRSIGDVIRRMPGMEVSDDGEIKFNGKSISNFYIDGDDLLADRYAIGSKTIPFHMVEKLEVLQNHQQLKVLQNKVLSDKVAVNLVIKEEAKLKLSGEAKLGAGLPAQYDSEFNTVLFNKKYKMLNVLKGNNIGENLLNDFRAFNRSSFLSQMDNAQTDPLLSLATAETPSLPELRYYFNHSGAVNANNLVNLKNGLQVKSMINLLIDRNDIAYNSRNELYLAQDTVRYEEKQDISKKTQFADITLNAEANKPHYYLKNEWQIAYTANRAGAALLNNNLAMHQQLKDRIRNFSNHLQYVPELRNKNVIRTEWYFNYFSQPQQLLVSPGPIAAVLNDSLPYSAAEQRAEVPSWFNHISFAYLLANRLVNQQYRIGMLNEMQKLHSDLRLRQSDGSVEAIAERLDNELQWARHRYYTEAVYEYKRGKLEARLQIPISWQSIRYHDDMFQLRSEHDQLLFNPAFNSRLMVNAEDHFSVNYAFKNQFGHINGVYRGPVLINYRTVQANAAELQEQYSHQTGLDYHFQRSLSLLFLNAGISWNKARANAILSSEVTDNTTRTLLIPLPNDVSSLSVEGGVSKYLFSLGATAACHISWRNTRLNQFLNNELLPYTNQVIAINPSIETQIMKSVSLNYHATANFMRSRLVEEDTDNRLPRQKIQRLDQSIRMICTPYNDLYLSMTANHQLITQAQARTVSYLFTDADIRFRIKKWHADVEVNLTNLANVKGYETYSISANSFWYSHYRLRGRMAVLKYTLNF